MVQRSIQRNHRLSGWTTLGPSKPILISAPENVTPAATGQPYGRMYPAVLSAWGDPGIHQLGNMEPDRRTPINLKMGHVKKGKQSKTLSTIPSTLCMPNIQNSSMYFLKIHAQGLMPDIKSVAYLGRGKREWESGLEMKQKSQNKRRGLCDAVVP